MAGKEKPGAVRMGAEWVGVLALGIASFAGFQSLANQHTEGSSSVPQTVGHTVLDHLRVFNVIETPSEHTNNTGPLFGYDLLGLFSLGGYMYARRS